jgi:hypothetical protein
MTTFAKLNKLFFHFSKELKNQLISHKKTNLRGPLDF